MKIDTFLLDHTNRFVTKTEEVVKETFVITGEIVVRPDIGVIFKKIGKDSVDILKVYYISEESVRASCYLPFIRGSSIVDFRKRIIELTSKNTRNTRYIWIVNQLLEALFNYDYAQ